MMVSLLSVAMINCLANLQQCAPRTLRKARYVTKLCKRSALRDYFLPATPCGGTTKIIECLNIPTHTGLLIQLSILNNTKYAWLQVLLIFPSLRDSTTDIR